MIKNYRIKDTFNVSLPTKFDENLPTGSKLLADGGSSRL
jgi:hypothetical protein